MTLDSPSALIPDPDGARGLAGRDLPGDGGDEFRLGVRVDKFRLAVAQDLLRVFERDVFAPALARVRVFVNRRAVLLGKPDGRLACDPHVFTPRSLRVPLNWRRTARGHARAASAPPRRSSARSPRTSDRRP